MNVVEGARGVAFMSELPAPKDDRGLSLSQFYGYFHL